METELGKVTAFVTRETSTGRELLVFQHPNAGIQLPAGTMERGESPEAAVLREVAEETGLAGTQVLDCLEVFRQPLEPDERLLLVPSVLQASPGDHGTLHNSVILTRGQTVRVIDSEGDYDRVTYSETRLDSAGVRTVSSKTGWLARRFLTSSVQRYLFHLTWSEETPPRWTVEADGHTFSLFWVSLLEDAVLSPAQQSWLDRVRDRL